MTLEELALKIAKEQGSDALDDRMGLGEMLNEYDLSDHGRDELAELVHSIHDQAWQLYTSHQPRGESLPADEHHYDVSCDDRPHCVIPEHHALEDMS